MINMGQMPNLVTLFDQGLGFDVKKTGFLQTLKHNGRHVERDVGVGDVPFCRSQFYQVCSLNHCIRKYKTWLVSQQY